MDFTNNLAVSEVMGTVILIGMAVTFVSGMSLVVLNPLLSDTEPITGVDISAKLILDESGNNDKFVIMHEGGISLPEYTKINLIIGQDTHKYKVSDDNDREEYGDIGKWSIGEKIEFIESVNDGDLVKIVVVDTDDNRILMSGTLQDGSIESEGVFVNTLEPEHGDDWARLWMDFSFGDNEIIGVRFRIKGGEFDDWTDFPSEWKYTAVSPYGYYLSLTSGKQYEYYAQIKYIDSDEQEVILGDDSHKVTFETYGVLRGEWKFEGNDPNIATDSSQFNNNGQIYGAVKVEDGISGKALYFDGENDFVEVTHHESLDIEDEITIDAWINSEEIENSFSGKIRPISDENLDSILGLPVYEPEIIHIYGNVYAIVYRSTYYGLIATIELNSDGTFGRKIDNRILEINYFYEPDISLIKWEETSGYYLVAFGASSDQGPGKHPVLLTVEITKSGQVTLKDAYYDFNNFYGREPNIQKVNDNIFAIEFSGSVKKNEDVGYLLTIEVDSGTGYFSYDTVKDSEKFSIVENPTEADIILTNSGFITIVYGDRESPRVYMVTYIISNNDGRITFVDQRRFTIDYNLGREPELVHVSSDIYAVVFGCSHGIYNQNGWLMTFSIGSHGEIYSSIDEYVLDSQYYPVEADIIQVSDNIFAISFSTNYLYIKQFLVTLEIDENGNIFNELDSIDFQGHLGFASCLEKIQGNFEDYGLIVSYGKYKTGSNSILVTVSIDISGNIKTILKKSGSFGLETDAKILIGSINDKKIKVNCLENDWNHITMTYDKNYIKLYRNDVLILNEAYTQPIATPSIELILGGYQGKLDELSISSMVSSP